MSDVPTDAPEGRGAFGGFIGPRTLTGLVRSAAPYLFDGSAPAFARPPAPQGARLADDGDGPLGWWAIVRRAEAAREVVAVEAPTAAQTVDYFALCVACHFASAATYVPTDVDTKIRDRLWFSSRPPEERERLKALVRRLACWDLRPNSRRWVAVDDQIVSGHDGERLSILCGGLLALLADGDAEGAAEFEAAVDDELRREAAAFDRVAARPGKERDLLLLSAILTHNAGDVDQGLAAKGGAREGLAQKAAFGELARRDVGRYGGAFARAAALYRECMAAEGHRHYPLREARSLRRSPDLLLPIGPFFDGWGETLARYEGWSFDERAEAVSAIVEGVRKVKGQVGYYRALAGFHAAYPGGLDAVDLAPRLPASVRRDLKDAELRRLIAVRRESFESTLAKKARAVLAARR
ncbi:MAG TPA: hypothetical protein VEI02_06150 [Planctomycetota bacterium]|nr:hypothetical protein [Planctomycetota bacterium]